MSKPFRVDYSFYDTLDEAVKAATKRAVKEWDTQTVYQAVKTVDVDPATLPKTVVADYVVKA